jgi:Na+-transporting NADH:ubiquinone oxidoreductase subunit D
MLSQKTKDTLLGPLNANNPVVVQILGICSALAVTVQLKPALVMGIAVTIIVAMANVIVSLIRNTIPMRVRIIVQLVVVAALVTLVSEILKAFAYDVAMQLSVYLGLIITNCILMGRLEAFAMTNNAWDSFLDGLGNGLGYAIILLGTTAGLPDHPAIVLRRRLRKLRYDAHACHGPHPRRLCHLGTSFN